MSLLNNFTNLLSQVNTIINENSIINIINEMEEKINKLELENTQLKEDINVINKELIQKKEEILDFSKVSYFKTINKEITEKNNKIKMLENQLNKYKTKTIHIETKSEDINSIFIKSDTDNKQHIEEYCNETIKPKKLLDEDDDNPTLLLPKKSLTTKIKNTVLENNKNTVLENTNVVLENNINVVLENNKNTNTVLENTNVVLENTNVVLENTNVVLENTIIEEPIKKKEKKKKQDKTQEEDILEKCDDINGYELITYKKTYYLKNLETNELYNIINFKPDNIVGYLTTSGKVKFK